MVIEEYMVVLAPFGEVIEPPPTGGVMIIERMRDTGEPTMAVMMCPCGCGCKIRLPLLMNIERRVAASTRNWVLTLESDNAVSLDPEISQVSPCNTAFTVRKNKVTQVIPSV